MSPRTVVVVGAGFAGLAACDALIDGECEVTLLSAGAGASSLTSGAADDAPWLRGVFSGTDGILDEGIAQFLSKLSFRSAEGAVVATSAGCLRETRLMGPGVLNCAGSSGPIALFYLPGQDSRAQAQLASLAEEAETQGLDIEFLLRPLEGVFTDAESGLPLAALATLLDDKSRHAAMQKSGAALQGEGIERALLGPWLGTCMETLECIAMGLPKGFALGETLSPPEGPQGRRFESSRRRFLEARGIQLFPERVETVRPQGDQVFVLSETLDGAPISRLVDSVVLATGGIVGGGIELSPQSKEGSDWAPRLTLAAAPCMPTGSVEGWDPMTSNGAWLQAGASLGASHYSSHCQILFAGDVRARFQNEPAGSVVSAVRSGLSAARALLA